VAHQRKIAVIGLGYVGLPVATAFARSGAVVIGFDVDRERIQELQANFDRTREVEKSDSNPELRERARNFAAGRLLYRHRTHADR
jgi:UDP-N-acetyl-D-galactosamine dehydrogenase